VAGREENISNTGAVKSDTVRLNLCFSVETHNYKAVFLKGLGAGSEANFLTPPTATTAQKSSFPTHKDEAQLHVGIIFSTQLQSRRL
jgi:hypothetical protein